VTTGDVFDEIGPWSEVKLDIIRKYAQAYSLVLTKQKFYHVYIDAFAGAGINRSRTTGEFIPGSPLNALWVKPPFNEYHFIDLDNAKVDALEDIAGERGEVYIYHGDCNEILLEQIFPRVRWEEYKRALCVLDPYGLHLNWTIIETAGRMRSIEIFLNFPIMDMNRNVLHKSLEKVSPEQIQRMNSFWGDESWRDDIYKSQEDLFGKTHDRKVQRANEIVAKAFRQRLQSVAGFKYVPAPVTMRNSKGATLYYLFFAAQKPVSADIVIGIFNKYQREGA